MSEKVIKMQRDAIGTNHWFGRVVENIRAWNARRVAKAELRAMPDYLLKDIGMRRDQVDACVEGKIAKSAAHNIVRLSPSKRESDNAHQKAA